MLDDANVLKQRDSNGALEVVGKQYEQANYAVKIQNAWKTYRPIKNLIVAGMGGSALAALLADAWLKSEITVPFEIVRDYDLPAYVNSDTLVIASSYSGNTEETISCLDQAERKNAQISVIASGGKGIEYANQHELPHVQLPSGLQPRMAVIYNLRLLVELLIYFGVVNVEKSHEIATTAQWLQLESANWLAEVPTERNYAKQLAQIAVGKSAIFYGGTLTAPVAYKFKISWNENAKNLAFWNELPEFNHNEFQGWASHPIEKPFVVFDVISSFEHPRILRRFEVTDRLLSGQRPKSNTINLAGDSLIKQLLWGSILSDFVSVYLAILNNVDPTPVELIEKFKAELG